MWHRTDLSAGVDVYAEWVDACDAVAKEKVNPPGEDDEVSSDYDLAA